MPGKDGFVLLACCTQERSARVETFSGLQSDRIERFRTETQFVELADGVGLDVYTQASSLMSATDSKTTQGTPI
jgi:hypothetical protein